MGLGAFPEKAGLLVLMVRLLLLLDARKICLPDALTKLEASVIARLWGTALMVSYLKKAVETTLSQTQGAPGEPANGLRLPYSGTHAWLMSTSLTTVHRRCPPPTTSQS